VRAEEDTPCSRHPSVSTACSVPHGVSRRGRLCITIALKPRRGAAQEDMIPYESYPHYGFAGALWDNTADGEGTPVSPLRGGV
jgi:hypothetical protein